MFNSVHARLLLAVVCVSTTMGSNRANATATVDCGESPAVVLIGDEADNMAMFRNAEVLLDAGFSDVSVGVERVSNDTDLVLAFVSAPDGPRPATRESIEELAGFDELPLALVLSETDQVDDPELRELVQLEATELLERNGISPVAVLTLPNRTFVAEVSGLLGLPAVQPVASCDGTNEIVLVGQRNQFSLYVAADRVRDADLGDVAVGIRDVSESTELVLVVVSATTGLRAATRSAISDLADLDVPRVGLLITESGAAADQAKLDSVRTASLDAFAARGFDQVPVIMTTGWPTIDTGVTEPYDVAFTTAVRALREWNPGDPAPADVLETIPPLPTLPEHAVLENVNVNIPISSATEILQAQGFEVVAVPTAGNFGRTCDPLVNDQVPVAGVDLPRGTRILLAINVDSGTEGDGCPYWEISFEEYEQLVQEILAQPGVPPQ